MHFSKETKMLRSFRIRLFLTVIVCVTMTVASVRAQALGRDINLSTGKAVAMLVGVGAAIGLVAYLVIPKQKTIRGCVEAADNVLDLTDVKDKKTYVLESESSTIKPGRNLKVKGKKSKDKSGALRLSVRKIVNDFGPCTQAPIS